MCERERERERKKNVNLNNNILCNTDKLLKTVLFLFPVFVVVGLGCVCVFGGCLK